MKTDHKRNPLEGALKGLKLLAEHSDYLFASGEAIATRQDAHVLQHFVFFGPDRADDALRIGVFAGLDRDAETTTWIVVDLIRHLILQPRVGRSFIIAFYPRCNFTAPEGSPGLLERDWLVDPLPEVRSLASELRRKLFDGVIFIQPGNRTGRFDATLTGPKPLGALADFWPQDALPVEWEHEIVDEFEGKGPLSLRPDLTPQPFGITLKLPADESTELQRFGASVFLKHFLERYRTLRAFSINL